MIKRLTIVFTVIIALLCSTVSSSAAGDPSVVLVNPTSNSTVYSNNILISIKVTQPKAIRISVFEEKQIVNGTLSAVNINTLSTSNGGLNTTNLNSQPVGIPVEFVSKNNLSFYTKQINGLKPGLYRIRIDTIDSAGNKTYTSNSYVAVKEKTEEADAKIFDAPQSGTMQFLQNLLKNIFGD
ncbi:MAG: hypothetical protein PHV71_05040 [Eubacteriales bacterium]|nr:hypothetical protein [Eubacteriales bacterium]MDD3200318.1 hypothetical protein [Eubacteriales bacterium]MDD4122013.1 hypothetical protein [Eubacteriales bacterium]MDD4629955.1 hypothetical protein [Eubacteriales bacterium]